MGLLQYASLMITSDSLYIFLGTSTFWEVFLVVLRIY
jgi:hypothetical protein